jgi:hypothetical protein
MLGKPHKELLVLGIRGQGLLVEGKDALQNGPLIALRIKRFHFPQKRRGFGQSPKAQPKEKEYESAHVPPFP